MMPNQFDDETLMAFADGELDRDAAQRVEDAIGADPNLAARVAVFAETRRQAKAALTPMLAEPIPHALSSAVERMIAEARADNPAPASNVVAFSRPKPAARLERSPWVMALAASFVAAVIAGAGGYLLRAPGAGQDGHLDVAGLGNPALARALEQVNSGQEISIDETDQRFRVIASFRDDTGTLCREFEVDTADISTVVSVACRAGDAWAVNFAVVAPADTGGYAPASSTEALDAYLSAIGAGAPLSSEDETAALAELTRN